MPGHTLVYDWTTCDYLLIRLVLIRFDCDKIGMVQIRDWVLLKLTICRKKICSQCDSNLPAVESCHRLPRVCNGVIDHNGCHYTTVPCLWVLSMPRLFLSLVMVLLDIIVRAVWVWLQGVGFGLLLQLGLLGLVL